MPEQSPRIQDVNIELGDDVSRMLYEASKMTHANRPGLLQELHPSFSGLRTMPFGYFLDKDPERLHTNLAFDGVGTKVEIAERLVKAEVSERIDNHAGVAFDLFAMVCDDAVVRGAEPIAAGTILDVRQLNDNELTRQSVQALATGYVKAAAAAGVVVVNGEVAELGRRIGGYAPWEGSRFRQIIEVASILSPRFANYLEEKRFNYNWGAAVKWVAHEDRLLTGLELQPDDVLIGLPEPGLRSNGITDFRIAMLKEYGPRWHEQTVKELGSLTLGELAARPSTIYTSTITDLTGGYDITRPAKAKLTGVAHITGGGQPSKLGRMLEPSGYGAEIDNPINPPRIMIEAQRIRGLSDKAAYGKWHMGPGMIIATPEPQRVLAVVKDAQVIGRIIEQPVIRIKNCGVMQEEDVLNFELAAV